MFCITCNLTKLVNSIFDDNKVDDVIVSIIAIYQLQDSSMNCIWGTPHTPLFHFDGLVHFVVCILTARNWTLWHLPHEVKLSSWQISFHYSNWHFVHNGRSVGVLVKHIHSMFVKHKYTLYCSPQENADGAVFSSPPRTPPLSTAWIMYLIN